MIEGNIHKGFNKNGHFDENSIAECAEWLNNPERKLDPGLQKHLETCYQCKAEVLEIAEIIAGREVKDTADREKFEETCAAKHSPSIKPAAGINIWQVAAVIIVLVSITILALLSRPGGTGVELAEQGVGDSLKKQSRELVADSIEEFSEDTDQGRPSRVPEGESDRYAANFIPNVGLEALIGVRYRGRNDIIVSSPAADTVINNGLLKFIGQNPNGEKLELQVLNNKSELVSSYRDIITLNLTIDVPDEPGLYYWKLSGEEELYLVGKIEVEVTNK